MLKSYYKINFATGPSFYLFNCQIKCNTLSLKSSAGVFQSNRLRGRVF
ncbi:hypothetical protein ACUXJ9_002568, partial [Staphylococcus caledonicus]